MKKCALLLLLTLMACLHLMSVPAYASSGDFITMTNTAIKINQPASAECISITSTSIPDVEIGEYAFLSNTNLKSITLPEGLTEISAFTFANCSSLLSIALPSSVTKIGEGAFWGCTSLESITIPDHVTEIGASAFSECTSLTEITIPDSVTTIGSKAFSGCTSLTKVTVPKGVSISKDAFSNTPWLEQRQEHQRSLVVAVVGVAATVALIVLRKKKVFQ